MMIRQLSVVTTFIDELNESIKTLKPPARLTFSQRNWLRVVLPDFTIDGILADALYGHSAFMDEAEKLTNSQVVSQIRRNQMVKNRSGRFVPAAEYVARQGGVEI